ncbi:hypothetical protein AN697_15870 [Enterobacter cloacae subsp. cloacae]|nr:hypothetical protein AN697_15870 [Enterobacter cloacae subsp. cloacae]
MSPCFIFRNYFSDKTFKIWIKIDLLLIFQITKIYCTIIYPNTIGEPTSINCEWYKIFCKNFFVNY